VVVVGLAERIAEVNVSTTTKDRPLPPPVAGAESWEEPGWLPTGTGLDWLDDLRATHIEAIREWRASVVAVIDLQAALDKRNRDWRRSVRDAVAAGTAPPPREVDDAIEQAQLQVAREDAVASRDELSRVVVEVLAKLRSADNRRALEPHLSAAGVDLRLALRDGPGDLVATARAKLESQLERMGAGEPPMIDVSSAEFIEEEQSDAIS
jgi:hypothetical protein